MDDYISREAAIEYLMTNMGWNDEDGYAVDDADDKRAIITDLINGIPAADVRPVVRGHWLTWEEQFPDRKVPKKSGLGVFCSACHNHADNMTDFCPNCGADMRKEQDNG